VRRPAVFVFGLCVVVTTADAGVVNTSSTNIVIESYTGDRPADATRLLAPILDELAARGYSSGDTIGHRFDARASRASAASLPADFADQVDHGYHAYLSGRFDEALATLTPVVELAHADPVALADTPALADVVARALTVTALAQLRGGDPGAATATLGELARAFPAATVSKASYGGEAAELFAQVQRDVAAQPRAHLAVTPSEPSAVVFVDEHPAAATVAALPPGEYRVFAKAGKRVSRVHRVVLGPNDQAALAIDLGFDTAVRTAPWSGLAFASAADREAHEGRYARSFAGAIGAGAVIVVGIDAIRGRASIVASLVSLQDGRELRRASVPLDPDPSTERLRALARYVAGDDPQAGIEVLGAASAPAPAVAATAPTRGGGPWKWIAGAGALAALGTGGALIAIDGTCAATVVPNRPCANVRETETAGLVVGGVGVALAAVAVYLFVHRGEAAISGPYVAPTPGGATAGYVMPF
jgi:hypothetical protein